MQYYYAVVSGLSSLAKSLSSASVSRLRTASMIRNTIQSTFPSLLSTNSRQKMRTTQPQPEPFRAARLSLEASGPWEGGHPRRMVWPAPLLHQMATTSDNMPNVLITTCHRPRLAYQRIILTWTIQTLLTMSIASRKDPCNSITLPWVPRSRISLLCCEAARSWRSSCGAERRQPLSPLFTNATHKLSTKDVAAVTYTSSSNAWTFDLRSSSSSYRDTWPDASATGQQGT